MNNLNINISFCGSSYGGCNAYPKKDYNKLRKYYNNSAPESWLLHIQRINNVVKYDFVKYGLTTSFKNGRTGSFFCISIEIENFYFDNPIYFYEKYFCKTYDTLLKQEVLIAKQVNQTSFLVNFLSDQRKYLDDLIAKIESEVIKNESGTNRIVQIADSINSTDQYAKIHVSSNPKKINKFFTEYGAIQISDFKDYFIIK